MEIFVDTFLEVYVARDSKGLYARAMAGEISNFIGVSAFHERPLEPDIHLLLGRTRGGDIGLFAGGTLTQEMENLPKPLGQLHPLPPPETL